MERGAALCLVLVVWLGLDFNALTMSVLGTYFYFGLSGMPLHMPAIALVMLLAFGGPAVYGLLLARRSVRWESEILLGLQLGAYTLCTLVRQSDVFAWTTVFGLLVSGVAMVSLLRRLKSLPHFEAAALSLFLAVLLHLTAQLLGDGLIAAIRPAPVSVALLVALLVVGAFAVSRKRESASPVAPTARPARSMQVSAVAIVPLAIVGVALIYNPSLWSAKTPAVHAAVYSSSFVLGTAAGFLAARAIASRTMILVGSAATGFGLALYAVLHLTYSLPLGLLAHGAGCYGLAVFACLFLRKLDHQLVRSMSGVPLAGLQVGAVIALLVIGTFLATANPVGLWIASVFCVLMFGAVESRLPIAGCEHAAIAKWAAAGALLSLLPALFYGVRSNGAIEETGDMQDLTVMTSNARYGWTDDGRFEPDPYVEWLREHPATIIGLQEINKGGLYGGFMDLFEYYRRRLPGNALYGDANFGFGNALFTSLPVLDSRVTPFAVNGSIRRSYLRAVLENRGRKLVVFVTHLAHLPPPNTIREAQVEELLAELERTEDPWILMGDLNADWDQDEIEKLANVSSPIIRAHPGLRQVPSYPAGIPRKRLDYVFFSDDFEVVVEEVVLDTRSTTDHRAVTVTLRLAP